MSVNAVVVLGKSEYGATQSEAYAKVLKEQLGYSGHSDAVKINRTKVAEFVKTGNPYAGRKTRYSTSKEAYVLVDAWRDALGIRPEAQLGIRDGWKRVDLRKFAKFYVVGDWIVNELDKYTQNAALPPVW